MQPRRRLSAPAAVVYNVVLFFTPAFVIIFIIVPAMAGLTCTNVSLFINLKTIEAILLQHIIQTKISFIKNQNQIINFDSVTDLVLFLSA